MWERCYCADQIRCTGEVYGSKGEVTGGETEDEEQAKNAITQPMTQRALEDVACFAKTAAAAADAVGFADDRNASQTQCPEDPVKLRQPRLHSQWPEKARCNEFPVADRAEASACSFQLQILE